MIVCFKRYIYLHIRVHQAKKSRIAWVHQADCLTSSALQPVSVGVLTFMMLHYIADFIRMNGFNIWVQKNLMRSNVFSHASHLVWIRLRKMQNVLLCRASLADANFVFAWSLFNFTVQMWGRFCWWTKCRTCQMPPRMKMTKWVTWVSVFLCEYFCFPADYVFSVDV